MPLRPAILRKSAIRPPNSAIHLRGPFRSQAREPGIELRRYILFFLAGALLATAITCWLLG